MHQDMDQDRSSKSSGPDVIRFDLRMIDRVSELHELLLTKS